MTPLKIPYLTNKSKTFYYAIFKKQTKTKKTKNNETPVLPEKTATNNRNLTQLRRNAYDFKGYRSKVCQTPNQ